MKFRKCKSLVVADLGCQPRSGSLSATLKSRSTQNTALIPGGVLGSDGLRSILGSTRIHCVALGQLLSSLCSRFSSLKMQMMTVSAMSSCCHNCKALNVVIIAASTMGPSPAALVTSAGHSWGTAPSSSHSMKEGQATGCPTPFSSGEGHLTQQQHPGSHSSWEQSQRESSKEVAGPSARCRDLFQGLVSSVARLSGGSKECSRETSPSFRTTLPNMSLGPRVAYSSPPFFAAPPPLPSESQPLPFSPVLSDLFKHSSSLSLLFLLPPVSLPSVQLPLVA